MVAGVVGLMSACTVPPPACPPDVQRTQPAAQLLGVTDGNPTASLYSWLAAWWWANPDNCPPPTDPGGPPAVVPESPLTLLLPLAALVTGGLGLIVVRRRRRAPQPI